MGRTETEEILSLVCRLCLWIEGDLEPSRRETLLADLAEFGVFAEQVRELAKEWLTNHPISEES